MKFARLIVIVAGPYVLPPISVAQAPAPVGPTAPAGRESTEVQPVESLEAVVADIEHSVGDLSGLDKTWEALTPSERKELTTELEQIRRLLDSTAQQPVGPEFPATPGIPAKTPRALKPPFKAVMAELEGSVGELRSLDKSREELTSVERNRLTIQVEKVRRLLDETIEKPVGPAPPLGAPVIPPQASPVGPVGPALPPGTPTIPPRPPSAPKPAPKPAKPSSEGVSE